MLGRILFVWIILFGTVGAAHGALCLPGEYSANGNCYSCPVNATCDGTDFTCIDGFYKNGIECTQCSVDNSTCTGPDDYSCLPSYYDKDGACMLCPENAVCNGTAQFHCADGFYKAKNKDEFIACMSCAGHMCDGEKLISCAVGYWYQNTSDRCIDCKNYGSNVYCPGGLTTLLCKEGYYIDNVDCRQCSTGYFCPQGESNVENRYELCAVGYYRTGTECSKCDNGVECPGGKTENMTCSTGLFLHNDGRCLPYTPGDPGLAPNCNPGFYDNNGICTACAAKHSTCTGPDNFICMAGYYKNGDTCTICPNNSSCPAGSTQISCKDGYYLSNNQCKICVTGYYCNNNIKYECPPATGVFDTAVPDGYTYMYTNMILSSNLRDKVTDCRMYNSYFSNIAGVVMLWIHNYDGTNYKLNWKNTQKYWKSANSGYYLDTLKQANGIIFYANSLACTNAPDDSYYVGAGTPNGNDCPWRCNDGYYRNDNLCLVCPEGTDCQGGTIVCNAGQYADGDHCVLCPDGYGDNPNRGVGNINGCQIKCNGGSYIATSGDQQCTNVGAGYWNGVNYTNYGMVGTRNQCEANLTTAGYGAGADEAADCGRVLHIGDRKIYLRRDKKTTPSLNVKIDDTTFYGNMTEDTSKGTLRIKDGNTTYSVYDDSM